MEQKRLPVLDGLRGVAILLVLGIHLMPDITMPWRILEWAKKLLTTGGWIGVDLFFVLSGFLITGILLRTRNSQNYFSTFYARRILRIFPPYYGALLVVFVLLPAISQTYTEASKPILETQWLHWLYLSNLVYWAFGLNYLVTDYLQVGHLWSLAVEEHFYLLWPAIIFVAPIRTVRLICAGLIVSSLAIRAVAVVIIGPESGFYFLTPCVWDELAWGALIATVFHDHNESQLLSYLKYAKLAALAGSIVMLTYFFATKGLWMQTVFNRTIGHFLLSVIFGSMLFIVLLSHASISSQILEAAWLRFFGKISYGLYLIHGLLMQVLDRFLPTEQWISYFGTVPGAILLFATKVAICSAIAFASWHLYEVHFLKLKQYFPYRSQRHLNDRLTAISS